MTICMGNGLGRYMLVNWKAVLLMIVRLPPWLPAMLTEDKYVQLTSGGVVMVMRSFAMMRLVIVVLIVKSKRLPMSVEEKAAVGLRTKDGVMPEILTLVALSMVRPLLIWLLVTKVKFP